LSRLSGVAKATVSLPASRCTSGGREVSRGASDTRGIATRTAARCRLQTVRWIPPALLCAGIRRRNPGLATVRPVRRSVCPWSIRNVLPVWQPPETVQELDGAAAAHPEEPFEPERSTTGVRSAPPLPESLEAAETRPVGQARQDETSCFMLVRIRAKCLTNSV